MKYFVFKPFKLKQRKNLIGDKIMFRQLIYVSNDEKEFLREIYSQLCSWYVTNQKRKWFKNNSTYKQKEILYNLY